MKNNKYLTEEQLNEKIEDLFINESVQLNEWIGWANYIRNHLLTPASIFLKRSGKVLQSPNPFMRGKADELYHGYTNTKGKWIPGLKDRHPILKPLVPASIATGYVAAPYVIDKVADAFTQPKITRESKLDIKTNVIVEAGHILETLHDLELVEALVANGSIQLNEVMGAVRAWNWLKGLSSKAAIKMGDELIKLGTKPKYPGAQIPKPSAAQIPKPPANFKPLTKAETKIANQQKKADRWIHRLKDDDHHTKGFLRHKEYIPGYSDADLHSFQTLNRDSLWQKTGAPLALGAQLYLYQEYGPTAVKWLADMTPAGDIYDTVMKEITDAQHEAEVTGDREWVGMDSNINTESYVLDKFSNVICEADMTTDDNMRSYIDIINGNSLNEGVLSWIANKVAAKPKKFSADDFSELLKDTDVTVIVKTRDRLAKSIQNAGADPALSNEVKTLDNIISQRINNSHK